MNGILARGITYSVLGVVAWGALQVTPPVAGTPGTLLAGHGPAVAVGTATLAPVAVQPPPAPTVAVAPVVVQAQLLRQPDTVALNGTIHSSLMASLDHVGTGDLPKGQRRSLAWRLADIFEHRVDMSRDLDDGDQFHVLVERLQEPNGKIIVNKILGAKLSLGDHVFEAIHFKSRHSSSEWFDGKGKSLTASFLHAPLSFEHVSSTFGLREHPIFGDWRNHTGTDYAAPMGTPVRAIGDGVVVSAGWQGGYGNMIDIRHDNGYVSRYGHLNHFARGIHPGTRVSMGSTIGYVGMTGWATGPHLHFEIRVKGVARDPRTALQGKSGDPLPASEARLFHEIRAHMMAALGTDSSAQRLASRD